MQRDTLFARVRAPGVSGHGRNSLGAWGHRDNVPPEMSQWRTVVGGRNPLLELDSQPSRDRCDTAGIEGAGINHEEHALVG